MHFNAKAEVGPQSQNELLQPQNNEFQQRQKKKIIIIQIKREELK